MSQPTLEDINRLTQWDTPKICSGLEIVCPERRASGFSTEPLVSLDPSLVPEHAVSELPAAIDLISRREAKIITAAKADDFSFEKLRTTMARATEIH